MSIDGQIGDAIVAAIQAIGLEVSEGPPAVELPDESVLRRKTPSLPPKKEPPQVVVVVGDTAAKVEWLNATQKLSTWPVSVVIITAGGRKHEDDERSRTWREEIERAVYDQQRTCFADLAGFNECNVSGKSPFDPQALDKDLVYLTSNFEVQVIETLASPL